jgi:hypothetical protein
LDVAGRGLAGKGLDDDIGQIGEVTILQAIRKALSGPSLFGLFPGQNPNTRLSANCYKPIGSTKSEKNFWAINHQRNARNTTIF